MPAKKKSSEIYTCYDCDKQIDIKSITGRIICPYCGSRILIKARSTVPKLVKAR